MKIVLLEPPLFAGGKNSTPGYHTPHIGLGLLSAALLQSGHEVFIIDPIAELLSHDECVTRIKKISPELVGLTAMTHNIMDAGRFATTIKTVLPDVHVALGGLHATIAPGETLKAFEKVNFLICGDADHAFPELISRISERNADNFTDIPGIWSRNNDGEIMGTGRTPFTAPEDFPIPAWELFPLDAYKPLYGLRAGERHFPVFTSRGCPFSCSFCNNVNSRKMRYRPLKNVLKELETDVFQYNAGSIRFIDEALTFNKEFSESLFKEMLMRGFSEKVEWLCMTRTDCVWPDTLALMKESGCRYISVGIESGNQEVLNNTGKRIKLNEAREAVAMITKAGITADALFLLGLPYDTPSTIMDTIKFACALNTKHASFSNVIPFPGTEVFEMGLRGEGGVKLLSTDWSAYERHFSFPMELESVSAKKLKFYHMYAYLRFYFTPGRISEFINKVNLKTIPSYVAKLIFG